MIAELEAEVQARGLPYDRWGMKKRRGKGTPGPLCNNCVGQAELFATNRGADK